MGIVEFDDEKFTILHWDIIDLFSDRKTCCHELRGGGKSCGKKAHFTFNIKEMNESSSKHYCKTHVEKVNYKLCSYPEEELKCAKCKQMSDYVIEDTELGWCKKHFAVEYGKYKRRCIRTLNQKSTKQSLSKLGVSMTDKLDSNSDMMKVDKVIIENQPALKNPTMKSIGSMLFQYFVIRGVCDGKSNYSHDDINTVSASGKLKVNNKTSNSEIKKGKTKKDEYDIRKQLGVFYTKALISDNELEILNGYKKKDDLCDAFLQAVRVHYGEDLPEWIVTALQAASKDYKKNSKAKKKQKTNSDDTSDSDNDIESEDKQIKKLKKTKKTAKKKSKTNDDSCSSGIVIDLDDAEELIRKSEKKYRKSSTDKKTKKKVNKVSS